MLFAYFVAENINVISSKLITLFKIRRKTNIVDLFWKLTTLKLEPHIVFNVSDLNLMGLDGTILTQKYNSLYIYMITNKINKNRI